MNCAHCGAAIRPEHIEDGLGFCVVCNHRTRVSDGEDDLVICPSCGQLRDRTAFQCRWCGASELSGVPAGSQVAAVQEAIQKGYYRSIVYRTPAELKEGANP